MDAYKKRRNENISMGKKNASEVFWGEEGWERRSNIEIYELLNKPTIDEVVRSKRLQWLGHMESGRLKNGERNRRKRN